MVYLCGGFSSRGVPTIVTVVSLQSEVEEEEDPEELVMTLFVLQHSLSQ